MMSKERVEAVVAKVVKLLDNPKLQPSANNSVIRNARRTLIAQIFWGDRIVAAMRDGLDYSEYATNMQRAMDYAAIHEFVDCCKRA